MAKQRRKSCVRRKRYRLPRGYLSVTQVEAYLRCPERYRRQYLEGTKGPPSPEQVEGSVMGQTMEWNAKYYARNGRFPSGKKLMRYYRERLSDLWAFDPRRGANVLRRAEKFLETPPHVTPLKVNGRWAIEKRFTTRVGGVPVVGIADVVSDMGVVDYKVGANRKWYVPGKSLQLMLYALHYRTPEAGYLLFEKDTGDKVGLFTHFKLDETAEFLGGIFRRVAEGITAGDFSPNPFGTFCSERFCPHWFDCVGGLS